MNNKPLAALALLALSGASVASDVSLVVHTYAYHTDGSLNSHTTGLGLKIHTDSLTHIVGAYNNSVYEQSAYYMVQHTYPAVGNLSVGWFAGVATGYNVMPILPMGGIAIEYSLTKHIGVDINYIPNIGGYSDDATMFSLTIR
jgi:hypothetical protein